MSQGSLWPHSHFSSCWQSYLSSAPKGQEPSDGPSSQHQQHPLRQGKVGDGPRCRLIPTREPRRSVCHVAALRECPIPGVPRNLTRNTVPRNLRKRKLKDARRTQTLPSSANSAEQPPYRQAANSQAGLDAYLWPLLGGGLPSESEPARPQMALATRSLSWVKNLAKTVKARLKLLWAVSSSSPYRSKSQLGAASGLSWPAPLEACIIPREGFSLPTTCLPCSTGQRTPLLITLWRLLAIPSGYLERQMFPWSSLDVSPETIAASVEAACRYSLKEMLPVQAGSWSSEPEFSHPHDRNISWTTNRARDRLWGCTLSPHQARRKITFCLGF